MSLEEVGALGGLIFLVIAFVFIILLFFYFTRKRIIYEGGRPDHLSLYFDESMDSIIKEHDILRKKPFNEWKTRVQARIATMEKSVKNIQDQRLEIDARIDSLEKEIGKLK